MWVEQPVFHSKLAPSRGVSPEVVVYDGWSEYTEHRCCFSTAFWLLQLGGLCGAHRFYLGLKGSGSAQLVMGLGSLLAAACLAKTWGAGVAVFAVPFVIAGIWDWWDGFNLRDMVREHNRALALQIGLNPNDTEWWEQARNEVG